MPAEPKPPRIYTPTEVLDHVRRGAEAAASGPESDDYPDRWDNAWWYALSDAFEAGGLNLEQVATIEAIDGGIECDSFAAFGTLADGRWWLAWSTTCHSGSCWAGGTFDADTKEDLVRLHMTSEQRAALLEHPPGNSSREAVADVLVRLGDGAAGDRGAGSGEEAMSDECYLDVKRQGDTYEVSVYRSDTDRTLSQSGLNAHEVDRFVELAAHMGWWRGNRRTHLQMLSRDAALELGPYEKLPRRWGT